MRRWIPIFAGIFLLFGLFHPLQALVGRAWVDGFGTHWFYWYVREILAGRQSPAHTDLFFYPWGKDIFAHTGSNLLDALLAAPLLSLFGPVAGYNLWIALLLLGNAWGGAQLARALGTPAERAWVGGALLVLNPYVIEELNLGRPTQALLLFPALCTARLLTLQSWRDALACGLWMALSAWTYWYYGLLLGGLGLIAGLWRSVQLYRFLPYYALAALTALVLVAPAALPMMAQVEAGTVPGLLRMDGEGPIGGLHLQTVEGDRQGLYVLMGWRTASLIDEEGVQFLPATPIWLLAQALVLLLGWRGRGLWMFWLGSSLLIAAGPALTLGDRFWPNPLYLTLIEHLPILRRWWWPERAIVGAVLVGAGWAALVLSRYQQRWTWLFFVLVLAQLAIARQIPLDHWRPPDNPALQCLQRAPAGAVIDLPLLTDQRNLFAQTLHHKPLLGGMLLKKQHFGMEPIAALQTENTLLRSLIQLGDRQLTAPRDATPADRDALRALGYRYVLVWIEAFARSGSGGVTSDWGRVRRLLVPLLGAPISEDPSNALFTLDGPDLSASELATPQEAITCDPEGRPHDGR